MGTMNEPPPEPVGGLAAENAINDKLTLAALETRRRNAELEAQRVSIDDLPMGSGMVARLKTMVEDPSLPTTRASIDEGEQFPPTAEQQSRLELLIPERYRASAFSTFRAVTDAQKAAKQAVRQWAVDAKDGKGPMLAIVGEQGCGKSHLLYAALRSLITVNVPVYARPWYTLADEMRYGGRSPFAPTLALEAYEVRAMLWQQRIVLLDEVRATASTDFDNTELAKFACRAYDALVAVLLTTNVNPLSNAMGKPAESRFTQVVIEGPDQRHLPE